MSDERKFSYEGAADVGDEPYDHHFALDDEPGKPSLSMWLLDRLTDERRSGREWRGRLRITVEVIE